jgi:hypothetical protein
LLGLTAVEGGDDVVSNEKRAITDCLRVMSDHFEGVGLGLIAIWKKDEGWES